MDRYSCSGCRRQFPALLGIPDLRVKVDAWVDFDEDTALARQLAAFYHKETYEQLIARVWQNRTELARSIVERRLAEMRRAERRYHASVSPGGWLGPWFEAQKGLVSCLEIGCGAGAFLAAVPRSCRVAGIDVSLAWLVTAKKRLEEGGLSGLLACACVERLPFPDASFDRVTSFDVLEHVANPSQMLAEVRRVTRAAGWVFCTTPNRFSLTAEPHVGVWGVGFLPPRCREPYVRWRRGMSYRYVFPLSLWDLRRLFRSDFAAEIRIPKLWEGDFASFPPLKRRVAGVYNHTVRSRLLSRIILPVAPYFEVVARAA